MTAPGRGLGVVCLARPLLRRWQPCQRASGPVTALTSISWIF